MNTNYAALFYEFTNYEDQRYAVFFGFFTDLKLPVALWRWGQIRRVEGKGGRCVRLTTLTPSCAHCSEILEASTSWSPKGLSRPVMG